MHSELRARAAFRLTGLRAGTPSPQPEASNLRPALAARFRDLTALRYDFPVVLLEQPEAGAYALPLTAIVDRLLKEVAGDDADGARLRANVLRLEREIRVALSQGTTGTLHRLWDAAAARLAARGDAAMAADLAAARKALGADGRLIDCDRTFPGEFAMAAWNVVQRRKAAAFQEEVRRLIVRLGEILAADEARSPAARAAARLREAVGNVHRDVFDFEVMARLVSRNDAPSPMSEGRRKRIRALLVALETQRFFLDESGFTFTFDRCGPALRAFRARYARLRSLARSLAMARLEVLGEYDESRHDAIFQQLRQSPLAADELARFPDYLVRVRDAELDPAGRAELLDLLASGMPAKVLVQVDDLLEDAAFAEGLAAVGGRADAITGMALGIGEVFVVQAAASALPRLHAEALRAMAYPGPALFTVFSGATGDTAVLPPYLAAAAATESRAFPTLVHDAERPAGEGSRYRIDANPQPDRDWPVHPLQYEDARQQRVQRTLAFTLADFVAADERFARHFMGQPGEAPVALADWLDRDAALELEAAPVIAMVDPEDRLQDVVADESIVALARRARERWRRLQKLAALGRVEIREAPAAAPVAEAAPAAAAPEAAAPAEAAKAPASDEAYIETPRCTTCNECTQLNDRMFAYDANQQAYIADLSAGTYRQLVEAAESCQVSIIHPGKPRDPQEEGLAELLERAQPFL
ncbi:MAG TPA: hypothetical protein VFK48_02305 [Usitatibacter sp.]|nr:hypothetical protein [Usitatibacter sp.]